MPQLEVELLGHLLVAGGRTPALGLDRSTARRLEAGRWLPYIPATALRGAVRMQLEALLKGAAEPCSSPYPFDGAEPGKALEAALGQPPGDVVARLFGYSGPPGERTGAREGLLRFGDALPVDPAKAARALAVRPGVELDDARSSAADRKLFFSEVAESAGEPLVFRADLAVGGASEEDLRLLRIAAETAEAIGAGKARGGGEVRLRWLEDAERPTTRIAGEPETATRARLAITLREPAHFGDGGPLGNHHGTRNHIPGATVRGALAWALLRDAVARPEDGGFRALFLDEERPVSFGDALPVPTSESEPQVRPRTRREARGSHEVEDLLVLELARERVNRALAAGSSGLYLRVDDVRRRLEPVSAFASEHLLRRTRTRVSLDRERHAARDGKLFSIEQLEPWSPGPTEGTWRRATYVSWIEGLSPAAARLLARLAGLPLLFGAGRNHGMGLAEVELRFAGEPGAEAGREAPRALTRAVADREAELRGRLGEAAAGAPSEASAAVVALVAQSSYVPGSPEDHPLADLAPDLDPPCRRFLGREVAGGYDQRPSSHRTGQVKPLKKLTPAIAAGSVYVYRIPVDRVEPLLGEVLPTLRRGVGRRRELGCGRFALWRELDAEDRATPRHNGRSEQMNVDVLSELKRELVTRAEAAANRVGTLRDKASQLRNLLQISQSEWEVPVLANFIRYQAARKATASFWRGLHQPMIDDLEWIEAELGRRGAPQLQQTAIQHYLGYLIRRYVYCSEAGRKNNTREPKTAGKGARR